MLWQQYLRKVKQDISCYPLLRPPYLFLDVFFCSTFANNSDLAQVVFLAFKDLLPAFSEHFIHAYFLCLLLPQRFFKIIIKMFLIQDFYLATHFHRELPVFQRASKPDLVKAFNLTLGQTQPMHVLLQCPLWIEEKNVDITFMSRKRAFCLLPVAESRTRT